MALVLLIGTLNRVMIVELGVPASLVAVMISLPLLFAPFRAVIGFRSDVHRSALGWRRVPFIWNGTLAQFGGLAIMPFAILVLAGSGHAAHAPKWIGYVGAAGAFLLTGAGLHTIQTVGLALATDLAPADSRPKDAGAGDDRQRAAVRRPAGQLHQRPADPGDPGRRPGDHDPECRGGLETGIPPRPARSGR
jgi:BCD family chlorophyll transporter-like MFS transporter